MIIRDELDKRIERFKSESNIESSKISALYEYICKNNPSDLTRISPFRLSKYFNLEYHEIGTLFIAAAKFEIFDFEWNLVCPICGGLESHRNIGDINNSTHHCVMCRIDIELDLNKDVEIAFTLNPELHDEIIDPYTNRDSYLNYYFTKSLNRSEDVENFFKTKIKSYFTIKQGVSKKISFKNVQKNSIIRLISFDKLQSIEIVIDDSEKSSVPLIVDMELSQDGFSPQDIKIPPCELTVSIKNNCITKSGFIIFSTTKKGMVMKGQKNTQLKFLPFLTGKKLLNNQSFRDLFNKSEIPQNLQIKASDITILFTDLKGSTELYDKTGDLKAYSLVQQHFDLLKAVVDKYEGALIKTIGDAIMAAFSSAKDAVSAADEMVKSIKSMNNQLKDKEHDIAIKVGLHSGNALAVNANDKLDYFGQTVNIAARIQGLAAGDEIWVTEDIYNRAECNAIITAKKYNVTKQIAELKGVQQPTVVYQCN